MGTYILRRLLHMIPTLVVISVLVFIVIQLPPGDFVTSQLAALAESDSQADMEVGAKIREQLGLDKPLWQQYFGWVGGFFVGDFGYSFEWRRPVIDLIGERLMLTFVLSFSTLLIIYLIAIPVGTYSACHQNSFGDYVFTSIGVLGLCIPNFILALVAMFVTVFLLGGSAGGMFSAEYRYAEWSVGKFIDLLKHLWVPVVVVGAAGTAGRIRVMRNSMLNVLREQYIMTARAKGLSENKVIYKYGLRIAINPLISGLGLQLPKLVSGSVIAAIVLGLPTTGPMFYKALMVQDMYLAGTFLMFLAVLLLLGNLMADILLAIADPRIRLE
ncbi:MAG: ABC transporter permease [Planctomycetes bacterium]|nr:ABC transporter permease [Planctomycetota bacterium]